MTATQQEVPVKYWWWQASLERANSLHYRGEEVGGGQREETQLIFYSEGFLHRNRQAVKCVRWQPSVVKLRCCYRLRQDAQISWDSASWRFFWPAVQFLGESGVTTERRAGPLSCVGTEGMEGFNIWEITETTSEHFFCFFQADECRALFWIDTLYLLWQGLLGASLPDERKKKQTNTANAFMHVSRCYFRPGLIGTVLTIPENDLIKEIRPVGDCCHGLRKYKCENALKCASTQENL